MFGNGKVFVSHTHEDNAACESILAALDAWQVDFWFDTAQLSAGLEFFDYIQRALGERDIFLRVCTPAALSSHWMAEEQKLARALRAPNRSGRRLMVDLIVKAGYVASPDEEHDVSIDATRGSQVEWLRRVREALGIPSRERRISRRAVFGLGVTSLAALGAMGFAANLVLNPPGATALLPTGHEPTPAPLPGASRIRWTYTTTDAPLGESIGVALAGDTLFCSSLSQGALMALSAADGTLRWKSRYSGLNTSAPPTVAGDSVYFTSLDTRQDPRDANSFIDERLLVALRIADGSERWRRVVVSYPDAESVNRIDSGVTVVGDAAWVRSNQTLYAFAATSGTPLWQQSAGTPPSQLNEILPAPTVSGDVVYAVLGDGKLHAFAARDGSPAWSAPFAADLPIHSQPVAAEDVIYVGADGGDCFALEAKTGGVRWKTSALKASVDPTLRAAFTISGLTLGDGVLYVGGGFPINDLSIENTIPSLGSLQALDPATGKIHWTSVPAQQLNLGDLQGDYLRARPLVAGGDVFVTTRLRATNGRNLSMLFALDKTTGKLRWYVELWGEKRIDEAGAFPSAPVAAGDTLYIAGGNETLYALSRAN